MRLSKLCLSLVLSVIFFVGSGSSAFAYSFPSNASALNPGSDIVLSFSNDSNVTFPRSEGITGANLGQFNGALSSSVSTSFISFKPVNNSFFNENPLFLDLYDYYVVVLAWTGNLNTTQANQFTFVPSGMSFYSAGSHSTSLTEFPSSNFRVQHNDALNSRLGFCCYGMVPSNFDNTVVEKFSIFSSSIGSLPKAPLSVSLLVCTFDKGTSSDSVDSSIQAVIDSINQMSSDIQQSIEDQYGGDPGSSFPVEDIITQHNEKMGVLSFSSDVLMQVLGLLSPDQTLSSELVFPSMSLTIAGQRNKVQLWPEYRFDLNTLKQHWPDFIGLMQSLTTALVWIFVLRYCYRVFEKYFLAGGGS